MDGVRNYFLLRFLRDSELLGGDSPVISLCTANLAWIDLRWADLRKVNLSGAILIHVNLRKADLSEANLSGADLREVFLHDTDLNDTTYDDDTKWPDGFDPVAAGAKIVDQELPDKANGDASGHA